MEHGKAWSEAVAVHQEEIAARSDLFEKVKWVLCQHIKFIAIHSVILDVNTNLIRVKIAQMDENAGRDDTGLRKRMRTKGKTAVEEFKLAKKRGTSKKDKGRKAAAQALKMNFH